MARLSVVVLVCVTLGCGCRAPGSGMVPSRDGSAGGSGAVDGGGQSSVDAAATQDADVTVYFLEDFETQVLDKKFWAEGANFSDLDGDGHNDIFAGPFWWSGPDFASKHRYYQDKEYDGAVEYSNSFFFFPDDIDEDGNVDIVKVGFPGRETLWYRNPGMGFAVDTDWQSHVILQNTDGEAPAYVDIDGDGKKDLFAVSAKRFGFAMRGSDPTQPWSWKPITEEGDWGAFVHGMGVGDINGDGRKDVMDKDGWWEHPGVDPFAKPWRRHAFPFADWGGAQMFVRDLDGDGDGDVISSLRAHEFGLAWFEHEEKAADASGSRVDFRVHPIMGASADDNPYDVRFGEPHALAMGDINGDGQDDLVTGKRFWSHGPQGDPEGPDAKAVLYWFEIKRDAQGVRFVPHLIDDDSGVGTQVTVGDVDGDGLLDVVVGNKKGVFFSRHTRRVVDRMTWEEAQPKLRR